MFWKETDQKIVSQNEESAILTAALSFSKKKKKNSSFLPFVHVQKHHIENIFEATSTKPY